MEITKQLLLYTKGLVEQKEQIQKELLNSKSYAKTSSLRKQILKLNSKIQSTKTKMHNRVYAPVNIVYYKTTIQGETKYYQRILPLSKREIKIMYQITNQFNPHPSNSPIEIITIKPINLSPVSINKKDVPKEKPKIKSLGIQYNKEISKSTQRDIEIL